MSFSDKDDNIDKDTVNNSIVKTATISTVATTFTTRRWSPDVKITTISRTKKNHLTSRRQEWGLDLV